MTVVVLGGRGRLGCTLAKALSSSMHTIVPERYVYEDWGRPGAVPRIRDWFGPIEGTVFVAAGILDPALPETDLFEVNFNLPLNVLRALEAANAKVVTFGTIMERFQNVDNNYVRSKRMLGDAISAAAAERRKVLHVQVHTLFGGGPPHPFMFLGLILDALKNETTFRMTSGRQLREYHHIDDEVHAILQLARTEVGVVALNHGQPLSLAQIATAAFEAFDRQHLLKVGALPEPQGENFDEIFSPTAPHLSFRTPLPSIIEDLKLQISGEPYP